MKLSDILDEELNVQYINKELSSLDSLKKQLDAKITANPMLAKELSQTAAEIDKKLNSLRYVMTDYQKKKAMEDKQGVGTQTAVATDDKKTDATIQPVIKAPVAPTAKINPALQQI